MGISDATPSKKKRKKKQKLEVKIAPRTLCALHIERAEFPLPG
jgi:hypothetical protein